MEEYEKHLLARFYHYIGSLELSEAYY